MFYSNADNLPRQRKKQQEKAVKSGILDATEAAAENTIMSNDMLETLMGLAERVEALESASTSTTK